MTAVFYISGAIALVATLLAVSRPVAVHGLLYLVVSFLALGTVFFVLGAPFVGILEVVVYGGAIVVLFLFVLMMLNLGTRASDEERLATQPKAWIGPSLLGSVLFAELAWLLVGSPGLALTPMAIVDSREVGLSLYGIYALSAEVATVMLLAGLVGAFHIGRRREET